MTDPTYAYGSGWNVAGVIQKLTSEQQLDLANLLSAQQTLYNENNFAIGLGVPLYQALLEDISDVTTVNGQEIYTPKAGVDQNVFNWISSAINVNSQRGFAADFIGTYTVEQKTLRDGPNQDAFNLGQKASNNIAFNVMTGIIGHLGQIPSVEGLGVYDAGAAASAVFTDDDLPQGDYAGWAGTLLFPYLGDSNYYVNWLLNTEPFTGYLQNSQGALVQTTFKHESGGYDLVSSIEAELKTGEDFFSLSGQFNAFDALKGLKTLVGSPEGATASDQTALAKKTQSFFQTYYGLAPENEWIPSSNDLVFSQTLTGQLSAAFQYYTGAQTGVQYVTGTIAADSDLTAPDDYLTTVMAAGSNNDVIFAPLYGDALIDAGGGNDTIYGGGGNDLLFGGDGNNTLYAGAGYESVLVGGTGQTAKAAALVGNAVPTVVAGNNTYYSGSQYNIMIGGTGHDTFNVGGTFQTSIVWGDGGGDTINIQGGANVLIVNASDASLETLEHLNPLAFDAAVYNLEFPYLTGGEVSGAPYLATSTDDVILIDPSTSDTLELDGNRISNLTQGFFQDPRVSIAATYIYQNVNYQNLVVIGAGSGALGLNDGGSTPTVSLGEYQSSSPNIGGDQYSQNNFSQETVNTFDFPGSTTVYDVSEVDDDFVVDSLTTVGSAVAYGGNDVLIAAGGQNTSLVAWGYNDTLYGGSGQDTLRAYGYQNVLVAGSGQEVLLDSGDMDTLIAGVAPNVINALGTSAVIEGNGLGSTFTSYFTAKTELDYSTSEIVVDLDAGTAEVSGSGTEDTLTGIGIVKALGADQTLIASTVNATFIGTLAGDTLIGGSGYVVAEYDLDDVTVDLSTGTAYASGTTSVDSLISIASVLVTGAADVVISNQSSGILSATGSDDVVNVSGSDNNLLANGVNETLESSGGSNTLSDIYGGNTLISSGVGDSLIGSGYGTTLIGTGSDATAIYATAGATVDLATQIATAVGANSSDVLIGIERVVSENGGMVLIGDATDSYTLSASNLGDSNTLIAGSGAGLLVDAGHNDTLIGNADGSTLDVSAAFHPLIEYTAANVVVDLASDAAHMNGSAIDDTLIGASTLTAFGENDTLIGGASAVTFIGNLAGDTLVGGSGGTELDYDLNRVAVDLIADTASSAAGVDVLSAITDVSVTGASDTVTAGNDDETLTAAGQFDVLTGGVGASWLSAVGVSDTLFGGAGANFLTSSGRDNLLVAQNADNTLWDSGAADTLVASNGADFLYDGGAAGSVLIGNVQGSTLESSYVGDAIAAYELDDVVVDLQAGTASILGSAGFDTLIQIGAAEALGTGDTLEGSTGSSTLIGNGDGNTLVAGAAGTVAEYILDDVVVDMATQTAYLNGSSTFDLLIDLTSANVAGHDDTLIGGATSQTLASSGTDNSLVAGSSAVSLVSNGVDDTLIGNLASSVLQGDYIGSVVAYELDDVTIDLDNSTASGLAGTDTLLGFVAASALGSGDTLLSMYGQNTLYSNAQGNTLQTASRSVKVVYAANDMEIDLPDGTAGIQGSDISDTLIGVRNVDILGQEVTLVSDGSGNTLASSDNSNHLAYNVDGVVVDLDGGTASTNDGAQSDQFIGFKHLDLSGADDVGLAGSSEATLVAYGNSDTLEGRAFGATLIADAASSNAVAQYDESFVTIDLGAGTATDLAGDFDTLVGLSAVDADGQYEIVEGGSSAATLMSTGTSNTLTAGTNNDTLISTGSDNSLIAGTTTASLVSQGTGDTLIGNGLGSTLDTSASVNGTVEYNVDNAVVDLGAGLASISGSSTSDILIGVTTALVTGDYDQVLAASTGSALMASGESDTLVGGAGADLLSSSGNYNLLEGGIGEDLVTSSGAGDTLIAEAADDTLSSSGLGNTLIASEGADTLISTGALDQLIGNGAGSTLIGTGSMSSVAAYLSDDTVVDLSLGTAIVDGAATSDTLIGIDAAWVSGSNDTLIGGSGGDQLIATGTGDTVIGGTGDDTLFVSSGSNTFYGGGGANTFTIESAAFDSSNAQPQNLLADFVPGVDTIDLTNIQGVGSLADLTFNSVTSGGTSYLQIGLGTGQAIMLSGVSAAQLGSGDFAFANPIASNTILGNSGNNLLVANTNGDTLVGAGGYDIYKIGTQFGADVIQNDASDGTSTSNGEVEFAAGATDQNLWFQQSGNDLSVDLLGTNSSVTIAGWYSDDRAQVQTFNLPDGLKLDSQVAQLVSAMATYSANNPGFDPTQTATMPTDTSLSTAIAASWHT